MASMEIYRDMTVTLSYVENRNVGVLTLEGDMKSDTFPAVNQYFSNVMNHLENAKNIDWLLVDCGKVGFADSSWIGMISAKYVKLKRLDKRMALCGLGHNLLQTLSYTQLIQVFSVYPNRPSAMSELVSRV